MAAKKSFGFPSGKSTAGSKTHRGPIVRSTSKANPNGIAAKGGKSMAKSAPKSAPKAAAPAGRSAANFRAITPKGV